MRWTTVHPLVLLLAILTLVLAASACQPLPSAPPRAAPAVTGVPATPGAASAAPTAAAVQPAAEEEDCMASCHIPDANEEFAAGAGPQPATHIARTACLSCHGALARPALPAGHLGRMDPSCALCHKESAKAG